MPFPPVRSCHCVVSHAFLSFSDFTQLRRTGAKFSRKFNFNCIETNKSGTRSRLKSAIVKNLQRFTSKAAHRTAPLGNSREVEELDFYVRNKKLVDDAIGNWITRGKGFNLLVVVVVNCHWRWEEKRKIRKLNFRQEDDEHCVKFLRSQPYHSEKASEKFTTRKTN